MMKKFVISTGIVVLFAGLNAPASTWNQDVAIGAKWSDAGNWSPGVPGTTDTAIFNQAQANTLDVDVDVAGQTRLMQVQQNHTFNGSGSTHLIAAPASHFQNIMYNTASNVTYNTAVSVKTTTGYYGQSSNNHGGTTTFNNSYTLESGSLMNFVLGTRVFNGDLNLNGTLRLGSGSMVIGGSGTTTIASDYISTAGAGSELYLNRSGAYTLNNPASGYMRVEKTRIYFGADNAVAAGTDVRMYGLDAASALVSSGDYTQNFGWLDAEGPARFDLAGTAAVWTFKDSSAQIWDPTGDGALSIVNSENATIRFAIDSEKGTLGLRDEQIKQITIDGVALSITDVFEEGGYLYLCKPEAPAKAVGSNSPVYVGFYRGSVMDEGLYTFTDLKDPLGTASRIGTWPFPDPTWQGIGFDGSQYVVFNRGTSFGGPGLHEYDGDTSLPLISGSYDFSDWHGIGACNGVYYGLYTGSGLNGVGLYIFMDATDPEGTAVQLFSGQSFSSNVWTDVAFDGERYLFVRTDLGGDAGIYQYDPDTDAFTKLSGAETYADWDGLGVFDADIAPLRNKKAYVLLFGGQSNALGWGYRQYLLDTGNPLAFPQADIDLMYSISGTLYFPKDTLVRLQSGTGNTVVKPLPNQYPDLTHAPISRFSSELSFARSVRDQIAIPDMHLGVVKYAVGGTSLYDMADWYPDGTADRSADGAQYQKFQETVWKCIAAMKNKYPYHTVEILGMGWMQGESDAIEGQGASYEENLTRLIADVRSTFGLSDMPFVFSQLSTNQLSATISTPTQQTEHDNWPLVMAAQEAVAAADSKVVMTSTTGEAYAVSSTTSEGRYHYVTPALLQIGYDLADALISICGVDSDHDGLLDEWENNYAPGTTGLGNTPDADYDGDGFTDQEEFQIGTSPVDAGDYLKLSAVSSEAVSWSARKDVSYRMLQSTNLTSWLAIDVPLLFRNTNTVATFDVSNSIQNHRVVYFRLSAE